MALKKKKEHLAATFVIELKIVPWLVCKMIQQLCVMFWPDMKLKEIEGYYATLSLYTTFMDYNYGLRLWTTSMDYVYGLRLWTTSMDYVYGLRLWTDSDVDPILVETTSVMPDRPQMELVSSLSRRTRSIELSAKALMVIGSLWPISIKGVIRGLKWDIGPFRGETLSSHHIWMIIPPTRPSEG
jgi:hypothetical protein